MLINSMEEIFSLWTCISNHHIVHFKYLTVLSVISQLTWGINGYSEKAINNKGQRLYVAHTVKNINFLTLYRKRFANPVLIVSDDFCSELWLGLANERHQEKLRVIGESGMSGMFIPHLSLFYPAFSPSSRICLPFVASGSPMITVFH